MQPLQSFAVLRPCLSEILDDDRQRLIHAISTAAVTILYRVAHTHTTKYRHSLNYSYRSSAEDEMTPYIFTQFNQSVAVGPLQAYDTINSTNWHCLGIVVPPPYCMRI